MYYGENAAGGTGDSMKFNEAILKASGRGTADPGIGTLNEKTLHAVLKLYYEPCEARHEIQLGRYVADIVSEEGIIEIQTRAFHKLRDKLRYFLSISKSVTVVYPIAHIKWLCWIDSETGEISKKRQSPKTGTPYDAFYELYKIKMFLKEESLHIRLPLIDLTEYRNLNGWSQDKKKGSSRNERIPEALADEIFLDTPADYVKLIPKGLTEPFTVRDFARAAGIRKETAQQVLHIMHYICAVKRVGKKENQYLYETLSPGFFAQNF